MGSLFTYKSFNGNKTVEELEYNMLTYKTRIEYLESELVFFNFLLDKNIFESRIMNLFENLALFKKEISFLNKTRKTILNDLTKHAGQLATKIECDDLACDYYFINKHDELEENILHFFLKTTLFKNKIIEFIESVIKKE
jgi:hypothetical protein